MLSSRSKPSRLATGARKPATESPASRPREPPTAGHVARSALRACVVCRSGTRRHAATGGAAAAQPPAERSPRTDIRRPAPPERRGRRSRCRDKRARCRVAAVALHSPEASRAAPGGGFRRRVWSAPRMRAGVRPDLPATLREVAKLGPGHAGELVLVLAAGVPVVLAMP